MGFFLLLILRWIFRKSLSSYNTCGIPFAKVWFAKFKNFAKGSYHENFMKNIMYLLGIEKGDNVDVYHDSEDSEEELCNNIYSGIWYVN